MALFEETEVESPFQVSYFEIYQEKIRDLLAIERAVDPPVRTLRPRTPTSPVGTGSVQEGDGGDDDQSSHSGSVVKEKVPSVSSDNVPTTSENVSADSDAGFTVIDELGNAMDGRAQQTKTDASPKLLKAKRKSNTPTSLKDSAPVKRIHQFSLLSFGDANAVKKEPYLRVREHPVTGPYVEGLLWKEVREWADMERLMKHGAANRTTYATDMNEHSSRSHALFTVKITRVIFFSSLPFSWCIGSPSVLVDVVSVACRNPERQQAVLGSRIV